MSPLIASEQRILQLLPGSYIGGCESYAIRVSNYLARNHYFVTTLCSAPPLSKSIQSQFVKPSRQKLIVIPSIKDDLDAIDHNHKRFHYFQSLLAELHPSIIHAVLPIHFACISFLEAAYSLHIPVLITYQLVVPRYTPPLAYQSAHVRWTSRNTTISAVSKNNQLLLSDYYQIPLDDIVVINNCPPTLTRLSYPDLPTRNAMCSRYGLPLNSIICLTVGSLTFQKGHELILRAAPAVLRSFPAAIFVFIGVGHLRDDLQSFAHALGISSFIHFLGHQSNVPDFLRISDLFIFPTRFEGEPFALLEAAAANLPIVASTASGIAETFSHGINALLFPVDDVCSLTQAILQSLEDPAASAARAEHASQFINHLDEGMMLDSTMKLIQNCITKRDQ